MAGLETLMMRRLEAVDDFNRVFFDGEYFYFHYEDVVREPVRELNQGHSRCQAIMMNRTLAIWGTTHETIALLDDWREWLTRSEEGRMLRLRRESDRDDFIAAHALARICAARLLSINDGRELTVEQHCPQCFENHGPPSITQAPHLGISLSHSAGWVAAAVSHAPVGVDIEATIHLSRDEDLWRRTLAPSEMIQLLHADAPESRFGKVWVRKECLVKLGVITLDSMRTVDLSSAIDEDRRVNSWNRWMISGWSHGSTVHGAVIGTAVPEVLTVSGLYRL